MREQETKKEVEKRPQVNGLKSNFIRGIELRSRRKSSRRSREGGGAAGERERTTRTHGRGENLLTVRYGATERGKKEGKKASDRQTDRHSKARITWPSVPPSAGPRVGRASINNCNWPLRPLRSLARKLAHAHIVCIRNH